MSDNTKIPILLDGDTGYGNFNNARRMVRKLEQRGVAGVCLEDKLFPKTNSLLKGAAQPLADIDEFCGKLRACKDTQQVSMGVGVAVISVALSSSFICLLVSGSVYLLCARLPAHVYSCFALLRV